MPYNTRSDIYALPLDGGPKISTLSACATNDLLAQADQRRLAEIDSYWALCRTAPEQAARLAHGAAPLLGDLLGLARQTCLAPKPRAIPGLSAATRRLLAVAAIRDALLPPTLTDTDPIDAFWEPGQVVGLKIVDGQRIVVLRYDGPLFNPGTVPENAVKSEAYGYLVCRTESIGGGGEFEYVLAFVFGTVSEDGHWKAGHIDLATRSDLMRDLPAMEALIEGGRLSGRAFMTRPFPTFPSASDALISRLHAHRAALYRRKDAHVYPDPDPGFK